jgi:hypothetical protein
MKRSRIFLGATTTLLAIAGIAAAKAHRVEPRKLWYYTGSTPAVHHCLQAPFATSCQITPVQAVKCFYITSPGAPGTTKLTLYTRQVNGTNCLTIARYNNE